MATEMQTRLVAQQAKLISALMGCGDVPMGFDSAKLHAAAASLARKRCRSAARAWPSLARTLGAGFRGRFESYADLVPLPQHGGPLADGRQFVDWLNDGCPLPEDVRLQMLAVDLRFRRTPTGLVPRTFPTLQVARLTQTRQLIVAMRWPRFGECRFRLRFGR